MPIDYRDPVAVTISGKGTSYNDFKSRIKVAVKWNDSDSKEKKLEKIITQKWIAAFTNPIEAWVDHRRTGYPKLPYNIKNDSNADYGVIADEDFIRRMPFVQSEITNNPKGVGDAIADGLGYKGSAPGGGIDTPLYFDTGNSKGITPVNF